MLSATGAGAAHKSQHSESINQEDVGLKSAWMTQPDPVWMQANNQTEGYNADLTGKNSFYIVI